MKTKNFISIFFLTISIVFSCAKYKAKEETKTPLKNAIKYAKGFNILSLNGFQQLQIKTAYQQVNKTTTYKVHKKNKSIETIISKHNEIIRIPIQKIVVTSTTHIPMIEMLQEETAIVGFPNIQYISSKKTNDLIKKGHILEVGKENSLNTEILLNLQPELVVGYNISNVDKSLSTIKRAGIPVIYNGDWLEKTPLGRAEWIKFFGLLFDKEKQADSIFKKIEGNYQNAKISAGKATRKPSILSGAIMSNDIWNLPAGESFVAQFLKDAHLNYLWKNTNGKGSLSLSFESVFDKGKDAEFWISPGYFSSKEQLLKSNEIYAEFAAFKNDKIYTTSTKKGITGGVLYYELGPTRPDLILKDLIKITHPELLPSYNLTFFEKMQ
jgi:iron complex transport system substrate-binding protein